MTRDQLGHDTDQILHLAIVARRSYFRVVEWRSAGRGRAPAFTCYDWTLRSRAPAGTSALLLSPVAVGKIRTGASWRWESPITLPSRALRTTADYGAGARLAVVGWRFQHRRTFSRQPRLVARAFGPSLQTLPLDDRRAPVRSPRDARIRGRSDGEASRLRRLELVLSMIGPIAAALLLLGPRRLVRTRGLAGVACALDFLRRSAPPLGDGTSRGEPRRRPWGGRASSTRSVDGLRSAPAPRSRCAARRAGRPLRRRPPWSRG
jgi:hypothetical protein